MGDPPPVIETLDLFVSNTNYNNISSNMQSLHEMQVLADRYINDPQQEDPVWLHAKMDGETGERRALVRSITVQYKHPWFGAGEATTNIPLTLTVVREPYWERTTARDLPDAAPAAAAVVVYDYTAAGDAVSAHNIVGDVGARIRYWAMWGTTALRYYWMGIRSANKHANLANFVDTWECEDGYNFTDATDTVDATASGGDAVVVSESGVDWDDGNFHPVLYLLLDNVSANEEDNLGNYLWMLRTQLSAGSSTWEVKLRFSYDRTTQEPDRWIEKDIVEVSDTVWQFLEMGVAPIGLRNIHAIINSDYAFTEESDFRVDIYARRTSGTANLEVDCLCPIPVDEGFCKIVADNTPTDGTVVFGQAPEGAIDSISYSVSTTVYAHNEVDSNNFILPPGDGRIYVIYATGKTSGHSISDTVTFNNGDVGKYYERWLSLRGSE
jgi:hypothetical protein